MERLRRTAPLAPLTLAGIVLPRLAPVQGEPARGPLPAYCGPARNRRYATALRAALDSHHPGQRAALYRVKGRTGKPPPKATGADRSQHEGAPDGRPLDRPRQGEAAPPATRPVGLRHPPHTSRRGMPGLRRPGQRPRNSGFLTRDPSTTAGTRYGWGVTRRVTRCPMACPHPRSRVTGVARGKVVPPTFGFKIEPASFRTLRTTTC